MNKNTEIYLNIMKKKTYSEDIFAKLSKSIIFGELKDGEILAIDLIAKKMGISRTPVREAVNKLEQEGWIETAHNGRKKIKNSSFKQTVEIYNIRYVLEPYLMELVCKNITNREIEELEEITKYGLSYLEGNKKIKTKEILEINRRFNLALYRSSKNIILCTFLTYLYDNILHYRILNLKDHAYLEASINEHFIICKVVKKRNITLAKRIVRTHIKRGLRTVISSKNANRED